MSIYWRFDDHEFPCLVTSNTADRKAIFSAETAARLFIQILHEVRLETDCELFAFVVMPGTTCTSSFDARRRAPSVR